MKFYIQLIFLLIFLSSAAQEKGTPKRLKTTKSFLLRQDLLPEGSGLAASVGGLWAHNDSGASKLYLIDTLGAKIIDSAYFAGNRMTDWEDITQDSTFFYIGDIGNNAGERDKVTILRIGKISLLERKPQIDTIAFSWPETEHDGIRKIINFDCEAMVAVDDSIFLFTKEYKNGRRTRVFGIPNQPGNYTAKWKATLDTKVLVTGAAFHEKKKRLVLCGYNLFLQPYLLVFPDIAGTDFFGGKCQKIKVRLPFRQVEGIDSFDGKTYYLINERFSFFFGIFHRNAGLHQVLIPD